MPTNILSSSHLPSGVKVFLLIFFFFVSLYSALLISQYTLLYLSYLQGLLSVKFSMLCPSGPMGPSVFTGGLSWRQLHLSRQDRTLRHCLGYVGGLHTSISCS